MTVDGPGDFRAIIDGCDETADCPATAHSYRCWKGRLEAAHIDPDCTNGKHPACPGWTFDDTNDTTVPCECACHDPEN